jgi:hypothetical protein
MQAVFLLTILAIVHQYTSCHTSAFFNGYGFDYEYQSGYIIIVECQNKYFGDVNGSVTYEKCHSGAQFRNDSGLYNYNRFWCITDTIENINFYYKIDCSVHRFFRDGKLKDNIPVVYNIPSNSN